MCSQQSGLSSQALTIYQLSQSSSKLSSSVHVFLLYINSFREAAFIHRCPPGGGYSHRTKPITPHLRCLGLASDHTWHMSVEERGSETQAAQWGSETSRACSYTWTLDRAPWKGQQSAGDQQQDITVFPRKVCCWERSGRQPSVGQPQTSRTVGLA